MKASSNSPLIGAMWMAITGLNFVAVTATVKIIGPGLPAAEAAFLRYLLGLVFLIPLMGQLGTISLSKPTLKLLSLRGAVHALGVILWFYAMARIPMADVTAMNYMSPIYVTLGAALFLGEKLAFRRILAILCAFAGVLIILRPGLRELSSGHIAMLGAALAFAGSYLIAKRVSDNLSPGIVVAMLSITVTIGLAPFAFAVWVTPEWSQIGWLFLVACFATTGHFAMTKAFQAAPVTVTQPVTFLQLLWATLIGAIFFAEPVDSWVVAGGVVIVISVSFITWREALLKRRDAKQPVVITS
ncbi:MAG: DMT family transporter [Pseudoruegeria sp.]